MTEEPKEALWSPDPIVGYRGWEWDPSRKILNGTAYQWETSTHRAIHVGDPGLHKAPQWGCLCGVNVYNDPLRARGFPILGKVELTGMVIEYEEGYRGEIGKIIQLAVWRDYPKMIDTTPERLVEDIEARYDDVLVTIDKFVPGGGKGEWQR
jgi:hypothetical protein